MASCASCAPLDFLPVYCLGLEYFSPYSSVMTCLACFRARSLKLVLSVRMYVMSPLS